MNPLHFRKLLVLITSVLSIFVFAQGQVRTTGQLSGTVVDPSDAIVPNATITVSEPSTGFTQTVTASSSGEYSFPELQPRNYQVTASAPDYLVAQFSATAE